MLPQFGHLNCFVIWFVLIAFSVMVLTFALFLVVGSFVLVNIVKNARISTRPSIIRKTNNHFNSKARDGPATPALNPVVERAEVASKIASIGWKPYELMIKALPKIKPTHETTTIND
jgi:hypothetical protein